MTISVGEAVTIKPDAVLRHHPWPAIVYDLRPCVEGQRVTYEALVQYLQSKDHMSEFSDPDWPAGVVWTGNGEFECPA